MKLIKIRALFGISLLVTALGFAPMARAQAASDEVMVGPVPVPVDMLGVIVTTEATSYFKVVSKPDGLYLDARLEGNLKDLQAKIGSIIDQLPLNRDNCASYKPDNILPSVSAKSLIPQSSSAVVKMGGRIEVWSCFENPVPATKLVWKMKKIGWVKTKVPVIETSPGSPFKTRTLSQSFTISIPAELKKIDNDTAGMVIGTPSVKLEGPIASTISAVASIWGLDLGDVAKKAIDKAVSPDMLIQTIPEEYAVLQPKVTTFTFSDRNGELLVLVNMSAKIPSEKLNEFVIALIKNAKKP